MANQQILMPQLGESVTEGTIERWLVKPGDKVNKYDPLAEVVTDKVNAEIPSSFSGVITELIANEGETLPVGAVVCTIEVEEAKQEEQKQVTSNISAAILNAGSMKKPTNASPQKKRYSPAVLKLAQEHNIDLQVIKGTGLEGRITRKDVLNYLEAGHSTLQQKVATNVVPQEVPQQSKVDKQTDNLQETKISTISSSQDIEIPVTSVRRAIANNMVRSKQEVPHAWMMIEADVTELVAYRNKIKDEFKKREGYNLTYFAFFVKAIAQALKEFPQMNSVWAGDKIIQKKDINISIAVATDDALFVPVIKNADDKTVKGIAKEIHELSTLVRSGKLRPEHMQGGTFTVNNTGSFGSVQSMGIINYPQAAIVQVESIVKRPVIMHDNMFAARDMVNLCLSLDHRILDGLICGKFLNKVKDIVEKTNYNANSIF
ncbi:dihydrolipoamide acetyltransferase family protein [Lysinibacillus endophyticus]